MSVQNLIDSLKSKNPFVNYNDFEKELKEQVQDDLSMKDLHELLKFTSDQYGYWMSNWHFSPETSPDMGAKVQSEGWKLLCQAFLSTLTENAPGAREELQHQLNLIAMRHCLQKRVDYNETKFVEKIHTHLLSKTAILLNKMGFNNIASNMYTKSLYPKDTVGRMA